MLRIHTKLNQDLSQGSEPALHPAGNDPHLGSKPAGELEVLAVGLGEDATGALVDQFEPDGTVDVVEVGRRLTDRPVRLRLVLSRGFPLRILVESADGFKLGGWFAGATHQCP